MNDVTEKRPTYGAGLRALWQLDPDFLTVNHGSFGATPRAVLQAQDEWRRKLEAQPSYFMRRILPSALRQAATKLANFVGAEGEDVAFVDNATVGCNAVLRSQRFQSGDEILVFDHGYAAVKNAARHEAGRVGASVIEAKMPYPNPSAEAIVAALEEKLSKRTKLVIIDHITSPSAILLPVERLTAACRKAGVKVLVDGAHGPGHVTFNLPALGADYYSGNCHKWLSAPKGCAFLWAKREHQAELHPVTISHGYGKGFLAEFDWTGTRDAGAYLAVDAAIDFHEKLGGATLRARNIALAREGAEIVAKTLGTEIGASPAMSGAMGLVRMPVAGPGTLERAQALRAKLMDGFRTDAPFHGMAGAIWVRLSAAAYNEPADYAKLGDMLQRFARQEN